MFEFIVFHVLFELIIVTYITDYLLYQRRQTDMVRQDLRDFSDRVALAVTAINTRIDALIAASANLTDEEKAALQGIVDQLNALGTPPV